jgi:hypothetical protein
VAAGPVGRSASAATDQNFAAEVYSYSRSRGLFAGVALDGTSISVDRKANAAYYKKSGVLASEIINGTVTSNDDTAKRFLAAVASSTTNTAAASMAAPAGSGAVESSSTAGSSGSAGPVATSPHAPTETRTFPMEDPAPGAEPK